MWYDQTNNLPDDVLNTAIHELGPGMDQQRVRMEDRAVVIWKEPKPKNYTYQNGFLFISPSAMRTTNLDPVMIPIHGVHRPYRVKAAGYIGEPGGYRPPGYERTPLPNRLMAFILTPIVESTKCDPGDLTIKPIYQSR